LLLQGYGLYASPYVFWELLSHLDEKEDFERYKGRLMKFKFVGVLDDPRAEFETPLLANDFEIQGRVPDTDLIEAALAALRKSKTLDTFYSSYIRDSKNSIHQITDCAANARKVLDEEEKRYIDFVKKIMQAFSSRQVNLETDRDRHQAILDIVEGYVVRLKQRGASEAGLKAQIIHNTYIYYSYIFHRALKYFKNNKTNLFQNDYEDGYMCLHLKLDTPYCLVTNDGGTREALNETASLLNGLNEPQLRTTLEICDAAHLNSLV